MGDDDTLTRFHNMGQEDYARGEHANPLYFLFDTQGKEEAYEAGWEHAKSQDSSK